MKAKSPKVKSPEVESKSPKVESKSPQVKSPKVNHQGKITRGREPFPSWQKVWIGSESIQHKGYEPRILEKGDRDEVVEGRGAARLRKGVARCWKVRGSAVHGEREHRAWGGVYVPHFKPSSC